MIYANYNKEKLEGKKENKKKLQNELGLEQMDAPLF